MKPKTRPEKGQTRDSRDAMRELLSGHTLSAPQAAILMAIHLRMSQDGSGWVSQDDIRSFTHLSQTAITDNTKVLETLELLEVTRRNQVKGQIPQSNWYRINFCTGGALPPDGTGALPPDGPKGTKYKDPNKKTQKKKISKRRVVKKFSSEGTTQETNEALPFAGTALSEQEWLRAEIDNANRRENKQWKM